MPGWVWDNYGRTVKMSVYLVAFAIMKDYAVEVTPPELYRLPVKVIFDENFTMNCICILLFHFD